MGITLFKGDRSRKGQITCAFLFGLGCHVGLGIFTLQKGYNFGVMFARPVFWVYRKGTLAFNLRSYSRLNLARTTTGTNTLRKEAAHLSSLG